jgi:UDP-N-acetylenolpyruvoylglucosamine reductase
MLCITNPQKHKGPLDNDEEELEIILNNIGNLQYKIIGAGSNVLIRDKGFDGIVF